jgi:hypothetical protein
MSLMLLKRRYTKRLFTILVVLQNAKSS